MDILNRQRREQAEELSRFQAGKKEESAEKKHTCFECRNNSMLGAISRNKTFSNSFRKRERRHLKRI